MVVLYALTFVALVIIAFPIYWLITTSVKIPADTATAPPVIVPTRFTLDNYRAALETPGVAQAFMNSIVVAVSSTILTSFLYSYAAYALPNSYPPSARPPARRP